MMDGWEEVKFGDVVQFPPKIKLKKGKNYPFIPMENLNSGIKYVNPLIEKEIKGSGAKFEEGDTLFSRITPCLQNGKIAQAKNLKNKPGFGSTEYFVFRGIENITDTDFIYYLSKSQWFKGNAENSMVGSSGRQRADAGFVRNLKINLPPLKTQRKIASILSAYDDLIENNLKRISLLEEKAQLTYEEWFVRMKFPGHDTAVYDKVSGLPVGWEAVAFSELVVINPRTTIKRGTLAPYIPMSSVSESSLVISPIEEREVSGGTKFKNGDTLFARITPCLENGKTGFVQFMENDDQIATGSTEYIVLREGDSCDRYFIYCTSRVDEFRDNAIKSMVGSDGRQRVKVECFDKYFINQPPQLLRKKFKNLSKPCFLSIQNLVTQNQLLKEARDLLLPRLMMGLVDVDELLDSKGVYEIDNGVLGMVAEDEV